SEYVSRSPVLLGVGPTRRPERGRAAGGGRRHCGTPRDLLLLRSHASQASRPRSRLESSRRTPRVSIDPVVFRARACRVRTAAVGARLHCPPLRILDAGSYRPRRGRRLPPLSWKAHLVHSAATWS